MNGNYAAFQFIYTVLAGLFGLVSAAIGFMVRTKIVQDSHEKRLTSLESRMEKFERSFNEFKLETHDSLNVLKKDLAVTVEILKSMDEKFDSFMSACREFRTDLKSERGRVFRKTDCFKENE